MSDSIAKAKQGLAAANSERFIRLSHETPTSNIHRNRWNRLAHGGSYSPYFRDYSFAILWGNDGDELKEYVLGRYPYLNGNAAWVIKNESAYFKPGINYGKRTDCLSVQFMPSGMIFTDEGQSIFPHRFEDTPCLVGLLNTRIYRFIISTYCGQHKHSGYTNALPVDLLSQALASLCSELALKGWRNGCLDARQNEVSNWFLMPLSLNRLFSIKDYTVENKTQIFQRQLALLKDQFAVENSIAVELSLTPEDCAQVYAAFPGNPFSKSESENGEALPEEGGGAKWKF